MCSTFLPDLLQQFHALCPQVELVLHTATTDDAADAEHRIR